MTDQEKIDLLTTNLILAKMVIDTFVEAEDIDPEETVLEFKVVNREGGTTTAIKSVSLSRTLTTLGHTLKTIGAV